MELLHGVHEAEVAVLDQVEKWHPRVLMSLGDGHDQAKVGLYQPRRRLVTGGHEPFELDPAVRRDARVPSELVSSVMASLDRLGQPHLILLARQFEGRHVAKVDGQEVWI